MGARASPPAFLSCPVRSCIAAILREVTSKMIHGPRAEIETTGGKLWRFDYRFEGKRQTLALGRYPDISLQKARTAHGEARNQLARGINPAALKKAQKVAGKERAANSFEAITREWLEVWKTGKSEVYYKQVVSRLKRDILPYIGGRLVAATVKSQALSEDIYLIFGGGAGEGYVRLPVRTPSRLSRVPSLFQRKKCSGE